jgi:hypothetical protein
MSNLFFYSGYEVSRNNPMRALSNFPRFRNFVAIKYVEVGNKSFPL